MNEILAKQLENEKQQIKSKATISLYLVNKKRKVNTASNLVGSLIEQTPISDIVNRSTKGTIEPRIAKLIK